VHPFSTALAVKKLIAATGITLVGLASLTACTADDAGEPAESAAEATEEATAAAPVVIECDYVPAEAAADAGQSIEAPLAMCAAGRVDTWDVAVTAVEADATATILATDAANTAPAEGSQYLMITLTGTNRSDAAAAPTDLLIGLRNGSWTYQSSCGTVPDDLLGVTEVAPGESFTANRCVSVETDKVEGAIIEMALLNSWNEEVYTYFAAA
jgi:hypothetical protein